MSSFKIYLAYKGAFGLTDEELYRTLRLARKLGVITTAHCENAELIQELQNQAAGRRQDRSGMASRQPAADRRSRRRPSSDDVCGTARRACLHRSPELRGGVA